MTDHTEPRGTDEERDREARQREARTSVTPPDPTRETEEEKAAEEAAHARAEETGSAPQAEGRPREDRSHKGSGISEPRESETRG